MGRFSEIRQAPLGGPDVSAATGLSALGSRVPAKRASAAYKWLRSLGLSQEQAWGLSQSAADKIARDAPHGVFVHCEGLIDLTGAYRLMAILCTDPGD